MSQNIDHIIIIHPSELLLLGFTSLFSEEFHKELILLKHPDEISNYPQLSGQSIVLIFEDYYNTFKDKLYSECPNCIFKFLEIKSGNISSNSIDTIHIIETKSSIVAKIKQASSSFQNSNFEKENNELSKREMDVLKLLTKGHSNKEIADKLFISTHTVISHRKNISEKTGIRSASGLTMYAVIKRIIDIDDISTSELI